MRQTTMLWSLLVFVLSMINLGLAKNPVDFTTVCQFPDNFSKKPGFLATTARLGLWITGNSYKELLNYPGTFTLTTQQASTTTPNIQLRGTDLFTTIYGLTVYPLYLLVELQGYFVPTQSGMYTFSLTGSDDAAIIFIGNPSTFPCDAFKTWPQATANDITVTDSINPSRTLYMVKGVAYPLRIAYYNGLGNGVLNAAFTDPSGTKRTDWNGYIWQYDQCSTCTYKPPPTVTTSITSGWVLSTTTTGTSYSPFTGIDGVESTSTIYQVVVPTITPSLSIPPITTVTIHNPEYVEEDVISFFSTTDSDGKPITGSTTINATREDILPDPPHTSFGPAPPPVTHTVDLGNGVTDYEVVTYWTTTNEFGGIITTSSTVTYSPPPVTVTATTAPDYVESDWISFFITVDEKGDIVTGSTTINATREYIDGEAPHTSFGPAPPVETKTVDLGNEVTEYLVISYWTTTNEFGGIITTSKVDTYSPPPVTVTATTAPDYVESDWISFFITVDEKGDIVTGSTTINATREYIDGEAPHTSFGPAPPVETKTVDLGNEVTEYLVISYWTTTNEFGGIITTSKVDTYSPPPVTVTATTAPDYVESDWISFFITVDEKGDIVTGSTTINATREYIDGEAPHTSFGPAPPVETKTVDLGNEVTEYLVISYWTTTNEFGGIITTSKVDTYSPPPVTVTATTAPDYVESDWISFFITVDEKGDIVTGSTTINATREYIDGEAPHTSFGPAPPVETKTVDLGNEVTEYLVISYWTTTNEFGGIITTSKVDTYSPPPVTVTATTAPDYVESDWISFFITVDEKGDIVTGSTTINATREYIDGEAPHTSFGPAPPPVTHTVDLGNGVTDYEVVTYWTTTNEFGGIITTSSTVTYSPPPVTVTATTAPDYVESDWISFFITVDEKGDIVTGSTTINATREYIDGEAPHTSFGPAPPVETKTVDLGNEVTEYLVISYWTTTNEFGGIITTSKVDTYSPPPVTVTATTAPDYVESDWISFFITVDEKGDIVTGSTTINATREYIDGEAPHTSFGPAPPVETKTVDLGNEVTEYLVISYWTTTNEFGGIITTSKVDTYSPPPVTVTATTAPDYVESDWISFFITVDEKGDIVTGSTTINATREYIDGEAPHTSFGPAPPVETKTVDLGNEVTEYLVISYWTTTNEFGGIITTSKVDTYSPPPVTVTATTAPDYVESDWISFFITVDEKGDIVTGSTTINATREYIDGEAPHTSFGPAPPPVTHTVDLGNGVTDYEVVTYWTTTNEFGGIITTSSTVTYSPPPVTVTATTAPDYVESDWISFFITVDEKGDIVTGSTTINATREYIDGEAPHTSFGPAPPVETKTVDLGNEVTEYLVISYWTTTNEFGGIITTSKVDTYSPPPVTVTATTAPDYVESDWISFFITVDEKGDIVTGSTTINATREYIDGEAPHTSFGPAPPVETKTVDLGNEVTEYLVISYWTTTNEFGGIITTSKVDTYSPPPVTVTATTAPDYVESDWISFFITVDEKGDIVTGSTTINATREYIDGEAPHTSFGPAPPVETKTVDLGNEVTEYLVISYWTTTNEFGGIITTS
ncbi:Flocculation protein FLO1, partial [Nakaseomyces glabratus]